MTLRPLRLALLLLLPLSTGAMAISLPCDGGRVSGGDSDTLACLGSQLKTLEVELNRTYQKALKALPESADNRYQGQAQLRRSQRAWLTYRSEQCALEGGMEGGGDLWVKLFTAECQVKETEARIQFLKQVGQ